MDVDAFYTIASKKRKHWQCSKEEGFPDAPKWTAKHARIKKFIAAVWRLARRPYLPVQRKRLRWHDSWHILEESDDDSREDDTNNVVDREPGEEPNRDGMCDV